MARAPKLQSPAPSTELTEEVTVTTATVEENTTDQANGVTEVTPDTEQAQVTPAPEQTTVEGGTAEAPADPAQVVTEAAAAPAEQVINLDPFLAAVEEIFKHANPTNGQIAPENLTPVVEQFRALEGTKAKNAARKYLDDQMKVLMAPGDEQNFIKAASIMITVNALKTPKGTKVEKEPKAPADPTDAYIDRYLSVWTARNVLLNPNEVPEGVAANWGDTAKSRYAEAAQAISDYFAYTKSTDENPVPKPDVPAFVEAGFKIAAGKAAGKTAKTTGGGAKAPKTGGYTGPARNVADHINEVFASKPVGTFLKVGEIANSQTSVYGTDKVSPGAVSQRIKSANFQSANPHFQVTPEGQKPYGVKKIS